MARLEVRIHKQIEADQGYFNWWNRHIVQCPFDLHDAALCRQLIFNVASMESMWHGQQVHFYLGTVGKYGDLANPGQDITERVLILDRSKFYGKRIINQPAPWHYGMAIYKDTDIFKRSKNVYFGCVDQADFTEDSEGRITWKNFAWLNQVIFDASALYWSHPDTQLLAPIKPTDQETAAGFLPATLRPGYVSRYNVIRKKQSRRDTRMMDLFNKILGFAWMSQTNLDLLNVWEVENGDFVPKESHEKFLAIVGVWPTLYQLMRDLLLDGKPEKDGKALKPVFRYGPDVNKILQVATETKVRADATLEDGGGVAPYFWEPDDTEYFRHTAVKSMREQAEEFVAKLPELIQADWKTDFFYE